MPNDLIIQPPNTELTARDPAIPALFIDAGEQATYRFIEFFTANIHNPNTRAAYLRAVLRFSRWCERRNLQLHQVNSVLVARYVQELGGSVAAPTVKQHLAAIRMLFDYLVTGQVVAINPAHSVRGPKHVVKSGKTPVLSAEQTRTLLDSMGTGTISGLRDRALIGVMVFSFARVSAVAGMNVEDYFPKPAIRCLVLTQTIRQQDQARLGDAESAFPRNGSVVGLRRALEALCSL